jgi:uncharacterized integral membrane protein
MTVQLVDYQPKVYQGQYGEFSITEGDRSEVIIYRLGLFLAGLSFTAGSLFGIFALALGISLLTIHIYLAPLHKLLQIFWLIGIISAIVLAGQSSQPLALYIYNYPLSILGMGFIFAALTGIYFKEAFCFNRLETKFLSVIVPSLLLGHLFGLLPVRGEQFLLSCWTLLFIVFVMRKAIQPIPPDIGDKSVFNYLKQQK